MRKYLSKNLMVVREGIIQKEKGKEFQALGKKKQMLISWGMCIHDIFQKNKDATLRFKRGIEGFKSSIGDDESRGLWGGVKNDMDIVGFVRTWILVWMRRGSWRTSSRGMTWLDILYEGRVQTWYWTQGLWTESHPSPFEAGSHYDANFPGLGSNLVFLPQPCRVLRLEVCATMPRFNLFC